MEIQMKMKLLLPLFLSLSMTMFGESLSSGGVVFALPVSGAYEFALMFGGYQEQEQAQLNGFHYGDGTFHLWKNGGPGFCIDGLDPNVPGCRFDGKIGKLSTVALDRNCTQITFPITSGKLQILEGGGRVANYENVTALYSQTFCNVNGSLFMVGGSLVVYL
jgi:hypothetical protein